MFFFKKEYIKKYLFNIMIVFVCIAVGLMFCLAGSLISEQMRSNSENR